MNKINTTNDSKISDDLIDLINTQRFKGKSILLLLSGGSNIKVAIKVLSRIETPEFQPSLHIGLVDERYGAEGHPDSNWQQLIDAGIPNDHIQAHPMLHGSDSITETTDRYSQRISDLIGSVDVSIGLFGIGADGHTAGLLPYSPIINSEQVFAHYKGADFKRISITPKGIHLLSQVFVNASGKQKWPAIEQLAEPGAVNKIPARVFKEIKNAVLYTDYKGELV